VNRNQASVTIAQHIQLHLSARRHHANLLAQLIRVRDRLSVNAENDVASF